MARPNFCPSNWAECSKHTGLVSSSEKVSIQVLSQGDHPLLPYVSSPIYMAWRRSARRRLSLQSEVVVRLYSDLRDALTSTFPSLSVASAEREERGVVVGEELHTLASDVSSLKGTFFVFVPSEDVEEDCSISPLPFGCERGRPLQEKSFFTP